MIIEVIDGTAYVVEGGKNAHPAHSCNLCVFDEDSCKAGCLTFSPCAYYRQLTPTERKKLVKAAGGNKLCGSDGWLKDLTTMINDQITTYMTQGVDYFSVDCGPWNITYDNTRG